MENLLGIHGKKEKVMFSKERKIIKNEKLIIPEYRYIRGNTISTFLFVVLFLMFLSISIFAFKNYQILSSKNVMVCDALSDFNNFTDCNL